MLCVFLALLLVVPCVDSWYMSQTHPPYDPKQARMVTCPNYSLLKLGCHNARDPSKIYLPRAIPEMLLTSDSSSGKYVGYSRSAFATYHDFLQRFICDCAEKVRRMGYTHFSISNYFECWSGKNVAKTYDMYHAADGCINGNKMHCDTINMGLCAGAGGLHFVYTLKSPSPTSLTTTPSTITTTQAVTTIAGAGLSVKCGNTLYRLRKLSCWNERDHSKAFPQLMLTATNHYAYHRLFAGYYVDTTHYQTFLKRFVCDCASIVSTKGYSMFGVSQYGQCWSGPNVPCTYQQYGRANDCVNQDKLQCSDASSKLCASPQSKSIYAFVLSDSTQGTKCGSSTTRPHTQPKTTAVTQRQTTPAVHTAPKTSRKVVTNPITTPGVSGGQPSVICGNVRYKLVKLGCWLELGDTQPPRAMPELILTARDRKSTVYAGYDFDRHNYAPFLERFMCDCVRKIKQKGYSVFGLQFYGECWSGTKVGCSYQKFGHTNKCVNQDMAQCSDDSAKLCSGDSDTTAYVYVPENIPIACPTNIPTQARTSPTVTAKTTPKTTLKTTPQTTTKLITPIPRGPPIVKCGNVQYRLTKLGCWNELGDARPPRAMPELLLTSRDTKSPLYVGYNFDANNYASFLKRFMCDCVRKVKQKGYTVFGLQFYGECWSGTAAGCTFEKFGESNGCVNERKASCSDDSTMLCSGDSPEHAYVYVPFDGSDVPFCPTTIPTRSQTTPAVTAKTTPKKTSKTTPQTTTKVTTPIPRGPPVVKCGNVHYKLTKLGCWNELGDARPPRAMPELLLTSRDTRSPLYVGYNFDANNYASFLKRFMCDCVRKVKQKGYTVFGLQFYGECWSGVAAGCTYEKFGKSNGCVNERKARCSDDTTMLCSGDSPEHAYVYVPSDGSSVPLCPTTVPTQPRTTPDISTRHLTTTLQTTSKVSTAPRTTPVPIGPARIKCNNVEYQLTKLGCYREFGHIRPPRALPELLLTAKDPTSTVYAGYKFYKQTYQNFIRRFACDCVAAVNKKGYSVFGLQFYGECWSGPRAACSYKTFGKSYHCVNEKLGKCSDRSSRLCSGKNLEDIYVYIPANTPGGLTCPATIPTTQLETTPKIPTTKPQTTPYFITTPRTSPKVPTTPRTTPVPTGPSKIKCGNVEYELTKLGCYKEYGHIRPPRVLPELLLTAKDPTSSVYAGYKFYKQTYQDFIRRFMCDCVAAVNKKGYSVFGLQFYGECWSGPRAACSYKTFGKSYHCVNEKLGKCADKSSRLCSGKNLEDIYVYIPANIPGGLTCPTTIPTTQPETTPKIPPTKPQTTPYIITTPRTSPKVPTTPRTTPFPIGPARIKCGNVEYQLTKLGCYKEFGHIRPPRVLPELLLTAKDPTSSVYAGYKFYKQTYQDFIRRFMCDCVAAVNKKGYSVFGLQFYGECWSGPRAACSYKTFGKSHNCVNEKLGECTDKSSRLCSGKNTEDVYVYVPANIPGGLTCPTTQPQTTPEVFTTTPDIITTYPTTPTIPTTPIPTGPPVIQCDNVEYRLTKLGCWKDLGHLTPPRAMTELLLTAKDKWSSVYAGYDYKKMRYDVFINRFICDCVNKVSQKGYSVFGLQFYAECWSGPRVGCTYKKFGQASECVNENLKRCSDGTSRLCSGHSSEELYVYVPTYPPPIQLCPSLPPTTSPTGPPSIQCENVEYKLTKLGCWKEFGDTMPPRAITELLLTARDRKSSVYVGYDFDKNNYQDFIRRFACDCVKKVNQKGYSVFGLQFYGECRSSAQAACTYKKFGQSSGCVNEKLGQCSDRSSQICSGHSSQEVYVYVPANLPATCPTASPDTTPLPSTATTSVSKFTPQKSTVTPSIFTITSSISIVTTSIRIIAPSTLITTPSISTMTPQISSVTPLPTTVIIPPTTVIIPATTTIIPPTTAIIPPTTTIIPPTTTIIPSSPSVTTTTSPRQPSVRCGNVEYRLRKLGCWSGRNDIRMPRAIPELLLTARDANSNVYSGYQLDTSNYAQFLERFICDCIDKVNTNGYSIFALQFYGECWSGNRAECTYDRYGRSNRCVNEQKSACSDGSSMLCSGDSPSNAYVYVRENITLAVCPTLSTVTARSTPPAPTISASMTSTGIVPTTSAMTTPTMAPFIPRGFECKKALDIVIALDASGSVMSLPYLRIRNFASSLTRRFTSFKPTYFGLLHYNYKVRTSARLSDKIPNSQSLRNRIRDMGYLGQATLTQAALTSAKALFDNGARNDTDVEKILILFTDGRTYGGKQTLREPLQKLREIGVRVTSVAVGNEQYLDRYSLLLIAGNPSNLLIIPSLENLGEVERYVDRVAFMICPK